MSHSGALRVRAVTTACDLGVDVELIRPLRDGEAIANRFFWPAEAALLAAFPPEEHDAAFFRCWTRTVAFLKATGRWGPHAKQPRILPATWEKEFTADLAADVDQTFTVPALAGQPEPTRIRIEGYRDGKLAAVRKFDLKPPVAAASRNPHIDRRTGRRV